MTQASPCRCSRSLPAHADIRRIAFAVLLAVAGCERRGDSPQEGSTGSTPYGTGTGTGTGEEDVCPGVPDPECTTNAGCGLGEICSDCMCEPLPPECAGSPDPECVSDSDCEQLEVCTDCICNSICDEVDGSDCEEDADCSRDEACVACFCLPSDDDGCPRDAVCLVDQDCALGESCVDCSCVAPRTDDPPNDCTDGKLPLDCIPDIDLLDIDVTCSEGDITVAATVAGGDPIAMPMGEQLRTVNFVTPNYGLIAMLETQALDGPYGPCTTPGGAGDSCGISADGTRWEFVLSAESRQEAEEAFGDSIAEFDLSFFSSAEPFGIRDEHRAPLPANCP